MSLNHRRVRFAWPPTISRPPRQSELLALERFEHHIRRCVSCCIGSIRVSRKSHHLCRRGTLLAQEIQYSMTFRCGITYSVHEENVQVEIPAYCVAARQF